MPEPGGIPDLEARLAAAVEPWLSHMAWRKDFTAWRKRRIWQERYQQDNLRDVRGALDRAPLVGGRQVVLDLGSGMGGFAVALLREPEIAGVGLQALDYNRDYCRIALLRAERYGLRLNIVVAAGEHLPYPRGSFSCVVCLDVLEHVADPRLVLREVRRVLAPGGVVLTTVPNRHAFRDPHYHLPVINWLPRPLAETVIRVSGRSKQGGLLHDRQSLSELNTYSWSAFKREASQLGFEVHDQVEERLRRGEVRQLHGWRRRLLDVVIRTPLAGLLYRVYRYGWQGTYQVMLIKHESERRVGAR